MKKIFVLIAFIVFIAHPAFAAVSVLDAWVEGEAARTISPGTNRLVVVFALGESEGGTQTLDSIYYGSRLMTIYSVIEAGGASFRYRMGIAYILDADIPTGSNAFSVSWSGNQTGETMVSATLDDIDQTTPVGDTAYATRTSTYTGETVSLDVVSGGYASGINFPSSASRATTWNAGLSVSPLGELTITGASGNLGVLLVGSTSSLTITASNPSASRGGLGTMFFNEDTGGAPPASLPTRRRRISFGL